MWRTLFLVSTIIALSACQALAPLAPLTPLTPSPVPTTAAPVISVALASPSPVSAPTATVPTVCPTIQPMPDPSGGFTVRLHPDGPLHSGDLVSLEVIAPEGAEGKDQEVRVVLQVVSPIELGTVDFGAFGIGGRSQATLTWAWDTSGLAPGEYRLDFQVLPDGPAWTEAVNLIPAEDVSPPEPMATWETVASECCRVNYITGTAAARDLEELLEIADEQGRITVSQMGIEFSEPIPVTLVSRVVGHGGFAANEVYVSYLDHNYSGNDFSQVLHHEMVHLLDGRLGGDLRPSILVEGLAVYLAGGHFKKEPLFSRAAALVEMGRFIPLEALADNFYASQHEIGYLEGAALVKYLVDTYGRESFDGFYRDIKSQTSGKQSDALDAALLDNFDIRLGQLEQNFLTVLSRQQVNPDIYDDLRLTIAYYDTVRRYQQLLDPSAHFLTAWLPDGEQMRQRGIVADFLRHPQSPDNVVIEEMLVEADRNLRAGDYGEAERTLTRINKQLNRIKASQSQGENMGTTAP